LQGIGIGPELRRARLLRGKSIEEASRETHIRVEYLKALERERFDSLLADVYVRGFLRSYSTYLGIDADRIVTIYNRQFGTPRAAATTRGGSDGTWRWWRPHLPIGVRRHPSWASLIALAIVVLAVLGAVGLLSRSRSVPRAASPSGRRSSIRVLPPTVTVSIHALRQVRVQVVLDGRNPAVFVLRRDESRSFEADSRIDVRLDRGGLAAIEVNGVSLGTPGDRRSPYSASFRPRDYGSSPSGSGP
jgi:hypothetical protein